MKKIVFGLILALATSAYADFTAILDAGRLRLDAATAMPTGSLLILVAAGPDGTFSNTLTPGQYVSGDDILLSVVGGGTSLSSGAFNMAIGTDETLNALVIPTNASAPVGELVALRWFPQITKAQFDLGITPSAGNNYGTYNPLLVGNGTNDPDGGDPWAVPSAGATINLNFFTSDTDAGGTQNPIEGFSPFLVVVPEPSTLALFSLAGVGLVAFQRRRKQL